MMKTDMINKNSCTYKKESFYEKSYGKGGFNHSKMRMLTHSIQKIGSVIINFLCFVLCRMTSIVKYINGAPPNRAVKSNARSDIRL